jgi:nitric oxide reductase NorQ protein
MQADLLRDLLYDRGNVQGGVGGTSKRFPPWDAKWGDALPGTSEAKMRGWAKGNLPVSEYKALCPPLVSPPLLDAIAAVMCGWAFAVRSNAPALSLSGPTTETQFFLYPRSTWNTRRTNKVQPRRMGVEIDGLAALRRLVWSVPGYRLKRDPVEYLAVACLIEGLVSVMEPESSNLRSAYLHLLEQTTGSAGARSLPMGNVQQELTLLSDELYFWMRFRGHEPDSTTDRFDPNSLRQSSCEQRHSGGFRGYWDDQLLAQDIPSVDLLPRGGEGTLNTEDVYRTFSSTGVSVSVPSESTPQMPTTPTTFKGMEVFRVVMAINAGMNVRLLGPHGTGKSLCAVEATRIASETAGSKVGKLVTVAGHESIQSSDLLGTYVPGSTKTDFVWADGPLTQAMREGRPLFVDEGNRMPTKSFNVLQTAISARAVTLLDRGSEVVTAEDGFLVVTAMNIGQAYAGVNMMDGAMVDRFETTIMFDYLDAKDESELVQERTGIDAQLADWMVAVAGDVRSQYLNRQLAGDLTPRGLIAWAQMTQYFLDNSPSKQAQIAQVMTMLPKWIWIPTVAGQDTHGRLNKDHEQVIQQIILNHKPAGL